MKKSVVFCLLSLIFVILVSSSVLAEFNEGVLIPAKFPELGGGASSTEIGCGDTITVDTTDTFPEGGLSCSSSTALYLGASVTLDCDGGTISGAGDVGVEVIGTDVKIENCYIEGFERGISSDYAHLTVEDSYITNTNSYGIFNTGDDLEVDNVDISDSFNGIYSGGSETIVKDSYFEGVSFGVYIYGDDSEVYNVEVLNYATGIDVSGSNAVIYDNIVTDVYTMGIGVSGDNGIIYNNNISGFEWYGIKMLSGNNGQIYSNEINDGVSYGIYLYLMEESHVHSNVLDEAGESGIYVTTSDKIFVYGNSISNSLLVGISLMSTTYSEVTVNQLFDNYNGVYFIFSDDNKLSSNNISGTSNLSISLASSDLNLVSNNEINNTINGIFLSGSNENEVYYNNFLGTNDDSVYSYGLMVFDLFSYALVNSNTFESNYFSGFENALYYDNVGDDNTFNSNYFCNSIESDVDCIAYDGDYSGSGNFMDTVEYCEERIIGCDIDLDEEGETYIMTGNIECNAQPGFSINAHSITLDCNGYTIFGDTTDYGVNVYANNAIIRNCIIDGFGLGVGALDSESVIIIDSQIQNSDTYGINTVNSNLDLHNVSFYDNNVGDVYFYGLTDHIINSSVMCSSTGHLECSSLTGNVETINSYIDSYDSDCGTYDLQSNYYCGNEPSGKDYIFNNGFPSELTNTYTCIESNGCKDGHDNDNDGLIDCADDECDMKGCSSVYDNYACIEGACIEVALPDAEVATVEIETSYIGYLWSYTDLFDWLNSATVIFESGDTCNNICANNNSKTCLFADAGRSLCSDTNSEKCTCV